MSEMLVTALGFCAGCCTTFAFVPQVAQVWRTRSTNDISLGMFVILVTGIVLWLIYGFLRWDLPLIAANAVTLVFAGTILMFKLRNG